jgi:hypothetical protein
MYVGVVCVALALAGCSDSDDDPGSGSATSAATTGSSAPATAPPATAPPTSVAAPFSVDTSDRSATSAGTQSGQLVAVRMANQEGFDRFVLEFAGEGVPMFNVGYIERPISTTNDSVVDVTGEYVLSVIVFPARTVDIEDPDFTPTYPGPTTIASDTTNVREAVFVEDFEANMQWVLGLDRRTGFEVTTLTDPPRVIVDVAHG